MNCTSKEYGPTFVWLSTFSFFELQAFLLASKLKVAVTCLVVVGVAINKNTSNDFLLPNAERMNLLFTLVVLYDINVVFSVFHKMVQ